MSRREVQDLVPILLLGFAALSPMSHVICSAIGAPHMPELIAIPLLFLLRHRVLSAVVRALSGKRLQIMLVVLASMAMLLALGLKESPRVAGTLSCARSYLWIVAVASVSSASGPISGRTLLLVSLGSAAGSSAMAWLRDSEISLGTIASVFHLALLGVGFGRLAQLLVVIPVMTFRVVQSAFRQVVVAAIMGIVLAAVVRITSIRSVRGGVNAGVVYGVGVVLVALGMWWYSENVGLTAAQQNRLVDHSVEFANDWRGESSRLDGLLLLRDAVLEQVFPKGFVPKGFDGNSDWLTMQEHGRILDLPVYELVLTLGTPLGGLLYGALVFVGGRAFLGGMMGGRSTGDRSLSLSFPLYLTLSWITGAFLWHTYEAAYFGLAVGRWLARDSVRC